MSNKEQKRQPIIIQENLEMANWMHPQTEERKKLIEQRVKEIKERLKKRNINKEING